MEEKTRDHETGMATPGQLPNDAPDSESRRKFGKAGLAVGAAVILTVASRPVLANLACQAPSGFCSGNVSQHGTPLTCTGYPPFYYGTRAGEWPSSCMPGTCATTGNGQRTDYQSDGTPFHSSICNDGSMRGTKCGVFAGSQFGSQTLMQVIWLDGVGDPYLFGAHMVAALLNAYKGLTSGVLTVQGVKDIWNEYDSKGYYEPTAGVKWYPSDIVAYLKSTMS